MSDQLTLSAELRERAGKGASRELRRNGRVPAVIYGDNKEPLAIHVEEKALVKALMTGSFTNSTVELTVSGGTTEITLPKDVAFHPVSDRPIHVDFFRLAKGATVHVSIPVRFINEEASPGLKRGGVLNVVRHELELICDATKMPDHIDIDVTGREVGDSIHISSVTLPAGSESAITDRDFTIATIIAPSSLKSGGGDTTTDAEPAA
jgi:large subunit ribosomal protein L25